MKSTTTKTKEKELTAKKFIESLTALRSPKELENVQRFFHDREKTKFLGVRMGDIFKLAKAAMSMPLNEVEKLLKRISKRGIKKQLPSCAKKCSISTFKTMIASITGTWWTAALRGW
jgi:hypothetical protein